MEDMVLYLEDIVTPTIKDFEANPTSVRHAFLACVATFHAIDYLAYPDKSANVRQRAREASPAFATVDLVAHAFKHVASGNPNKKRLKAGEVVVRRPRNSTRQSGICRVGTMGPEASRSTLTAKWMSLPR